MSDSPNRREFLLWTGGAMAGALLLPGTTLASTPPLLVGDFAIADGDVIKALQLALAKGGDYADLYFQRTSQTRLVLEDDKINRAMSSAEVGVGVRVVSGDSVGYSFTEVLTAQTLHRAAATASEIASGRPRKIPPIVRASIARRFYPTDTQWSDVGVDKKRSLLTSLNDRLKQKEPRIKKVSLNFSDEESDVVVVSSEGQVIRDRQPQTSLYVQVTAEDKGRRETANYNIASRQGFDFYSPDRLDRLLAETIRRIGLMFEAAQPKGGEMPVVLGAGASGILLHEAIGHGMEADFNRKGTSIYSTKLGKPVAQKFVNIVDDATLPNARGAINIDDEGMNPGKTALVEGGVLTSYLHDRISAKHYKVKPTGNGRRESFRHVVMPRMRCTYMENGPHKRDEIIASVKRGLYCESFSNGQVNIGAGDFTFFVLTGYLIEDGKLTRPVKDVNIIGNGPEALQKITMVADDLTIDEGGWTCGKNGQSVPVSQGMPTALVSSLTVGGKA